MPSLTMISCGRRERADIEHSNSAEANRSETQRAILQEVIAALKEEAARLDDDAWMFEHPRCTKR